MIRRLLVILLAAAACSRLLSDGETLFADNCRQAYTAVCHAEDASAPDLVAYRSLCRLGIAAVSYAGADAAPVSVRTLLHDSRPVWRHASCGFMVRAIDASRGSGRYGLYNHKILFASRAVDHYLHRMCRLVI